MKKKIIGTILLIGLTLSVTGCSSANDDIADVSRFDILSKQKIKVSDNALNKNDDYIFILQDRETKQKYVLYKGYRKAGLTPLIEGVK
jgi:hypothetical protein